MDLEQLDTEIASLSAHRDAASHRLLECIRQFDEARLLELALEATGAQPERLCRGYRTALVASGRAKLEERSVRRRVLPGGMVKLDLVLSSDEADLILRAVDRAREVHTEPLATEATNDGSSEASWPSQVDGAVALAESFLGGQMASGTGGDRHQVIVPLDQDPLGPDGTLTVTLEDGTGALSAETFHRMTCECGLVAGARTAYPQDSHRHWLHGGETRVQNVCLVCGGHARRGTRTGHEHAAVGRENPGLCGGGRRVAGRRVTARRGQSGAGGAQPKASRTHPPSTTSRVPPVVKFGPRGTWREVGENTPRRTAREYPTLGEMDTRATDTQA